MKISKAEIITFLIVLASFAVGAYYYPQLPERVASHWNASGEVNGYMPRFWGTFLMPFITLVILVILAVVPRVDPKWENIQKFRKYFDAFIVTMFLFLAYIYALTLAWNLGSRFDFVQYLMPAFSVLFWMAGVLISRSEPNWTIGIRTPWTLSSDTVWRKTHSLAAILFKITAIATLAGVIVPSLAMWFLFVPLVIAALVPFVYSYFLYRGETKRKLI